MSDQRDMLLREVDEELRREQLLKLWERYGIHLVALAALVVVGVGGYKYYEHRRAVAAEAAGARLAAAATEAAQNKAAEARKTLEEIASTAPGGYGALARLRLAAADRAASKTSEAEAAYEEIARSGIDPLLADYARLQVAMLKADSAGWTDMQTRLAGLTADDNPWRYSARELLGLAAYKAGKTEEARQQFLALATDTNVPPTIAERARVMMSLLTEAELTKGTAPSGTSDPAAKPVPSAEDKAKQGDKRK